MPLADLPVIQRIAAAHAKPELREAWALLLEFDNRLMAVAAKVQEPVLKQLRLAWWREQLAKAPEAWPKGEPLFGNLASMAEGLALPRHMLDLVDAWESVVAGDDQPLSSFDKAAELRAKAIFGSYAEWSNVQPEVRAKVIAAGKIWAAASMSPEFASTAPPLLPGLKPLNLLLLAVLLDRSESRLRRMIGSIRINFHALTGL